MVEVSWLLPVRNGARTVGACLRSIQRQTLTDWECVLVDDGSTDATPAIARQLARTDVRFRVVEGPARGVVAALERGLDQCHGTWIARIDADDVAHRTRLAQQLALVHRDALDGCGSHVRLFPTAALGRGMAQYGDWLAGIRSPADILDQRFVECPLAHPTWLIRSDVMRRFGYRDEGWAEDYDLLLRMLEADVRIGVVPRRLLAWRHQPSRLSQTGEAYTRDAFVRCKAQYLTRGPLAAEDRYLLWGYGSTGRQLRRALLAWDRAPSAIIDLHPGRVGRRIHGCPVVTPDGLAELPHQPLLVSIANARARAEVRAFCAASGRSPTFVA